MKINIRHIENTFNYGSCMMAITLINKINSSIDNVEFYVDCFTDIDVQRLKDETGVEKIIRYNMEPSNNILKRCINKLKKIKLNKIAKDVNIIIIIGGDDISEYYGIKALEKELLKLKNESKTKNTIMLGQTMGPFTENRSILVQESLKNTEIYTRDNRSLEYLLSIGFQNVQGGRDLAFCELPMQDNSKAILKKYKLDEEKYITIVPSGLTECYTKKIENYIAEQLIIIKNILNNYNFKNKKIVLLPHVLKPSHVDDRSIIKEIVDKLDEKYKERIVIIDDTMLPSEARTILGSGIFTITGRMHAAVSTFYMRKPAISLSYSVKYAGVIGDGLDMNELVIESADDQLWANGQISKCVNEKVNYVLDNYDELIKKIDIKVLETSKIVEKELNNVVKQIENIITN